MPISMTFSPPNPLFASSSFDAIPIVLDFSNLTPATICALPLNRSLVLSPDHWLYKSRHRKLPGAVLFTYDSLQGSIRLRVPHEISAIPRLALVKLYRDIFARRIDLQPWIWTIIGCPFDPPPPCSYDPVVTRWLAAPFWTGSVSKTSRAYQLPGCLPPYRFPLSMIKSFWSAPMDPRSRTVWYKILSNKLPLQHLLTKMHPQDPRCVLCQAHEDAAHFIYLCPKKLLVGESVLATHLPNSLCGAPSLFSRSSSTTFGVTTGTSKSMMYLSSLTQSSKLSTDNSDPSLYPR